MSNWSKKIGCALLSICFILAGLPGFTATASSDSSKSVPVGIYGRLYAGGFSGGAQQSIRKIYFDERY